MSPVYNVGGQRVRRKNFYMPCALGPLFSEMTPEQQADVLKGTYWADLVSASEWPALLEEDDFSPSARSRLKKKAAGWVIVLGRIAALNPTLFAEIVERATTAYEGQTQSEYPAASLAGCLISLQTFRKWSESPGASIVVNVRLEMPSDEDDAADD